MKLCCKLGFHKYLERKKVEIERSTGWCKIATDTGKKRPHSDFDKVTYIMVKECAHPGCKAQKTYRIKKEEGKNIDETLECVQIHPDMAKEKVFIESL